jgi:hypothetical protein
MPDIIPDDDREKPMGERHRMASRAGSHQVYARGEELVVHWYDFGDDALYEFIKLMIFGMPAQKQLAAAIGVPGMALPDALAAQVAAKFGSFFEVEDFVQEHGIPFAIERIIDP